MFFSGKAFFAERADGGQEDQVGDQAGEMGPIMRILQRATSRVVAMSTLLGALGTGVAFADGQPEPGQMGFEEAVTPIAREIHWFHNVVLLPIIVIISLFVAALLGIVIFKFNEKANPVPSKTTHHTGLEIAWTLIPVVILFAIVIPSMKLLTDELVVPKSDMTLKVTGKQWFWSYEYPADQGGGFSMDANLVRGDDFKPGMIRQLSVDNQVVVPVNKTIHLLVTGADVIHGFIIQAFGVRIDAVPGRMNESWFRAEKIGTYYGQCSKLCGKDHAFMPIAFKVVSDEDYKTWLVQAKKDFAANDNSQKPVHLAGAQ